MILHVIELYPMVLHCILWYCIGIAWYCEMLHCIVLNLTVLHGIALYHCWLRRAGCISQDTYLLYMKFIFRSTRTSLNAFLREDINGKNVLFRALPESPKPPP